MMLFSLRSPHIINTIADVYHAYNISEMYVILLATRLSEYLLVCALKALLSSCYDLQLASTSTVHPFFLAELFTIEIEHKLHYTKDQIKL